MNLTDVHGSTPLMDVIRSRDKEKGVDTYRMLQGMGKVSGSYFYVRLFVSRIQRLGKMF